jgi:symplekin
MSSVSVIKEMAVVNPQLLYDITLECPRGSELLVLTMVRVMLETESMTETKAILKQIFLTRKLGFNFMLLCLDDLSGQEILDNIDTMVLYLNDGDANEKVLKNTILKIVVEDQTKEDRAPRVEPSELLVRLHLLDENVCSVLKVRKVTDLCFAESGVFNQECLAIVLQRISEQAVLPTLMMRTLMQSVSKFPRLVAFTNGLLTRLVGPRLWGNLPIWEGVIRYCTV